MSYSVLYQIKFFSEKGPPRVKLRTRPHRECVERSGLGTPLSTKPFKNKTKEETALESERLLHNGKSLKW
jgi:hypothetical protein